MTTAAEFERHLKQCPDRDLLSDRTFAMTERVPGGGPELERMDAIVYRAEERGFRGEECDQWLRETYERWSRDPETFMEEALGPQPPRLYTVSARDLQRTALLPPAWVVEGLLCEGASMLASRPKMGKSWMVLDLCLRVARGEPFLGFPTWKGECLYLALEDNQRRLKTRLTKLLGDRDAPEGFYFSTQSHDLSEGLLEELETHVREHPNTKLIVIDTLQRVRPAGSARESAYSADYRAVVPLKRFADAHRLCLLLVHHLRKMGDDGDPFNRISGTNGILGALDTSIVLDRERRGDEDTVFSVTGRDVESQEKVIRFDKESCRWTLVGDASQLRERLERERYEGSPVVKTIRALVKQGHGQWCGSMAELMQAGHYIAKCALASSNRGLSAAVRRLDSQLFQYDNITHRRTQNGQGGGKHVFSLAINQPLVPLVTVDKQALTNGHQRLQRS